MSLATCQFLGSAEIEQILMIHKDNNGMRVSFKVMMPFSECTNYGEQLAIKDLIVTFSRVQGLREISAGMVLAIVIGLKEYCSSGNKGSIGSNHKLSSGIGVPEDWLMKEAILQSKEGVTTHIRPGKLSILLCQVNQGACEVGIMRDEVSVEVAKSKE